MSESLPEPQYPLEQVLGVKKDRVKRAEKVLAEKKRALEIEEEKLKKVEASRDKVLHHHNDKLAQLRRKFDEGSTSPEIQTMKIYLKVVKENLHKEEENVKKQKEQVRIAAHNVEEAQKDLRKKRKETEKLEMHKEEWLKGEMKELIRKEESYQNEVGTTIFETQKRKKRRHL
jgi:hypothetical protein